MIAAGALYSFGAPLYVGRIEDDLAHRVPDELADAGFQGISAEFDGQDGTLRCNQPLDDPEAAIGAAYDVWGVRAITLDRTDPQSISKAISSTTAEELTTMMVATVDSGTATPAQIPGVQVAGKTGTAQSTADRPPYAWFVSFAPADNPQVAVAVLVPAASSAARSPRRSWRR